ncbi:hypothetical protein M0812_04692 [Anaeramoeba flamelloides]|uniref:Uncharacterized protein n=1 Tax=Anaeramoeba flamelloides TaxID=1746091 RepID=A0AAV8AJH1_9EUKA|nr:hypothetical protein M0812_04692 [Anaeramoeba flamelloides]
METNRKREIRKCSRRNRNKRRRYNDSKQSMNHYKKLSILELAIQKKVQYNSTKNGIYRIKKNKKKNKRTIRVFDTIPIIEEHKEKRIKKENVEEIKKEDFTKLKQERERKRNIIKKRNL